MLGKFRQFLKQEPSILRLFILSAMAVAILMIFFQKTGEEPPSKALADFQKAEKKWQTQMADPKKLEAYMAKHPVTSFLYNLLSTVGIAGCLGGSVLIGFLLVRPQWRMKIERPRSPPIHYWSLAMLLKVSLIWITASFLLSMVMTVIRDFVFPELNLNTTALVHTTVIDFLSIFLIVGAIREQKGHWRDVGFWLRGKDYLREIGFGILGYMVVLPVFAAALVILVIIAKIFAYEPPPHPLVEIFLEEEKRAPVLIAYSIFLASVVGPVIEEIFFRGFLYPILRQKWGRTAGMVITSSIFAFIHQNQFAFWPIFILGMGLVYLYEKRDNLIAPMTMHLVHNTIFLGYFFLAKQIISDSGAMP